MMANRFRAATVIFALAIAGWAMTAIGCGDGLDDCQEAKAQIVAKYAACNTFLQDDDEVAPVECSDTVGAIDLCHARAVEGLSCACILGDMVQCTPAETQIFFALFEACG